MGFQWSGYPRSNIKHVYTKPFRKGPGYYKVKKFIISCGTESPSDEIPVSDCPIDTDNEINNNIDIDNDNDGITNCTESYGDKAIPVSSPSGNVAIGNYSNSYIGSQQFQVQEQILLGSAGDSFTTNLAAGITNAVLQIRFQQSNQSQIKIQPQYHCNCIIII
jgi:hypothetical protein